MHRFGARFSMVTNKMAHRQNGQRGCVSDRRGKLLIGKIFRNESGREIAGNEILLFKTGNQEIAIGLRPKQSRIRQCFDHQLARRLAGRAGSDELGNHRVVKGRDFLPTANARIIAHTGARQLIKAGHRSGARQKPIGRVFGIKPHFNRMTAQRDIFLRHAQPIAFRHFYLQGHQIETGHFFRHRMLDL